jgi:glycosyltransferase involved in cell wall biosynthesis
MRKLITIVSPCYNEEENIIELYRRICDVTSGIKGYEFEFLFIDNCSVDRTPAILRELASTDPRVRVILNMRNFGHIRSPYWGLLQSRGDASIYLASDLQDPPELIPQFIAEWEKGWRVIMMTKPDSDTNLLMHCLRKLYYRILDRVSDFRIVRDATGFGLYDKAVLDEVRRINDPYPFFRGLICELGFPVRTLEFNQPRRKRGISKNNFYSLYDTAMLGLTSHSLVPIRIAGFLGLAIAVGCIFTSFAYLILKLIYWESFPLGVAPLVIGIFFLFGLMFAFLGVLGEYIGSIHIYVRNRPIVVERERINFDSRDEVDAPCGQSSKAVEMQ